MTMNENWRERAEIEELLPWHAAGTLSRSEAKRVEDALARDPELARHYDLVREEMIETIHVNEALRAPSARTMDELFRKIDAEPARRPLPRLNLAARFGEFMASLTPRTLAYASGAAVLALLLQAGIITGVLMNERGGGYQTASAPATAPAEGSYAMIRFAPQASAADITRFLEANKLSVVSGPAAGGMFRVRVAVTGIPKGELARIVKQLQQDKTVDFIAAVE
jgi:hypothetical protein